MKTKKYLSFKVFKTFKRQFGITMTRNLSLS